MRALVTGGAGFIGSSLVDRLLAEQWGVDVVDDLSTGSLANLSDARADPANDFTFHRLDVRSDALLDLMARRRPEVVFHLAAWTDAAGSVHRPVFDADVNVLGALNVLEGARGASTRKVVYASSGFVEASPHAVSKRVVEEYLGVYRELHDLEFTALALACVYGPRMPSSPLRTMAERVLRGGEVAVPSDSALSSADYVFVDDVVDAFARAADRGGGLVLPVGTGVATSPSELQAAMAGAVGLEGPVSKPPGDEALVVDPARAAIHLGWKPWTTVPEGLVALLRSVS